MFSNVVTSELDWFSWLVLAARACLPLPATSRARWPTICWLLVSGRRDPERRGLTYNLVERFSDQD